MLPPASPLRTFKLYLSDTKLMDSGLSLLLESLQKSLPYTEEVSLDLKRTIITSKSTEILGKFILGLPAVQRVHLYVGGTGILDKHREILKRELRAKPGMMSVAVKM